MRGRAPLTQFPFAFLTRTRTSEAHPNFKSSYSIKPKDLYIFPSYFWKGRRESILTSPTSKVLVGGATTTRAPLDHCSLEKMHQATDEGGKSELRTQSCKMSNGYILCKTIGGSGTFLGEHTVLLTQVIFGKICAL